jgi:hypothetical protein
MEQVQEENKKKVEGAELKEIPTPAKPQEVQTLTLPSGKVAVIGIFKGKHIREATRNADGETDKMIFALIAMTTTIDGKKIVWEDLDEMDGRDVLKLQGAFSTNF